MVYILCSAESIGGYNNLLLYRIADSSKYFINYLFFSSAGQSSNKSVLIPLGAESCLRLYCHCSSLYHDYLLITLINTLNEIVHPYLVGEVDNNKLALESKLYVTTMFHHLVHSQIPHFSIFYSFSI